MMLPQLTVLTLFVTSLMAQAPTPAPVCREMISGASPTVDLAQDFTVMIEAVAQEQMKVTNMIMYYSRFRNQIRLSIFEDNQKSDMYFLFADNEILTFKYNSGGRGSCTVNTDLQNAADTWIVGGVKDGKIESPLAVLHFVGKSGLGTGEIIELPEGAAIVRDMAANKFTSCQKWTMGGATMIANVTHYFSDKSWSRAMADVVPVSIEVHGSGVFHNKVVNVDHYYNFFNYQPSVDPTKFETPAGMMCQGRSVDMPFPPLPTFIRMSLETVDETSGPYVAYTEEIYDSGNNFAKIESQGPNDQGTLGGMRHFTIIRDYSIGLSYSIDTFGGTCQVQAISKAPRLPVDHLTPKGMYTEVTPEQFFIKDNTKFEYIGERTVRGMTTDAWVARRGLPENPEVIVTVEWYFAKHEVKSMNSGSNYYNQAKFRMPVLFRVWPFDDDAKSIDVNIYHVDFTKIMYGTIDIGTCFPVNQNNFFQIVLNNTKESVVNTNIDEFKWTTAFLLARAAGVRWMRISDLRVAFTDTDTIIEFILLPPPPVSVDSSGTKVTGRPLDDAIKMLTKAVTSGTMTLQVWDPTAKAMTKTVNVNPKLSVKANSVSSSTSGDSGYTGGAMAGLGIAMVIVGGLGGGAGAFFLIK